MMKVLFTVFALLVLCSNICALKILAVVPFEMKSHFAIGNSIAKTLHDAGHNMTILAPYSQKRPVDNFREIIVKTDNGAEIINVVGLGNIPAPIVFLLATLMANDLVHATLSNHETQALMKSDEKFDVCVIEMFATEALLGLSDHFNCVLITYTTFAAVKWVNDMTGNQMPSSYVPHPFSPFTDKMSFIERLHNTYLSRFEDFLNLVLHMPNQNRLYRKYFPNARKSLDEMRKSSAIIFLNNHVSLSSARPHLPNMIEIGGIHVEPAKPLPKDLQEFLDSATDGAIVFSMGSAVQSKDWEVEKLEALVRTFGKLKQKVLWKYENKTLPNKPDNVMISSWLPQRDALAHPNVKLFITHGGLLGASEAIAEGVPVLGIPVFGDQKMNIALAVKLGYGLAIGLNDITEEKMSSVLNELLSNPKYEENAKLVSSRFVDRPMTPKETVLYWTEYAFKHKGAPHLKASGVNLNFIQFQLIDVYLTLGLIGLIILYFNFVVLKFILERCLRV